MVPRAFSVIYTQIINNFGEAGETPEHNALQARFLEEDFRQGLLAALGWEPAQNPVGYATREGRAYYTDRAKCLQESLRERAELEQREYVPRWRLEQMPAAEEMKRELSSAEVLADCYDGEGDVKINSRVEFEVKGWDIFIEATASLEAKTSSADTRRVVWVEIKPSLGDDYPAVLRQMKANRQVRAGSYVHTLEGTFVLLFDRFAALGASIEQITQIFKASGITVIAFEDVERQMRKIQEDEEERVRKAREADEQDSERYDQLWEESHVS